MVPPKYVHISAHFSAHSGRISVEQHIFSIFYRLRINFCCFFMVNVSKLDIEILVLMQLFVKNFISLFDLHPGRIQQVEDRKGPIGSFCCCFHFLNDRSGVREEESVSLVMNSSS